MSCSWAITGIQFYFHYDSLSAEKFHISVAKIWPACLFHQLKAHNICKTNFKKTEIIMLMLYTYLTAQWLCSHSIIGINLAQS